MDEGGEGDGGVGGYGGVEACGGFGGEFSGDEGLGGREDVWWEGGVDVW